MKQSQKQLSKILFQKNGIVLAPKRLNEIWIKHNSIDLYNDILQNTSDAYNFNERIKLYVLDLFQKPICPICKQTEIPFTRSNFNTTCSVTCSQKQEHVKNKIAKTCLAKYGVKRYFGEKQKIEFGSHHTQKEIINVVDDVNNPDLMVSLINMGWESVAKHFNLTSNSHSSTFNFLRRFGYEPNIVSGFSKSEKDICSLLKGWDIDIEENNKSIIKPLELDIYSKEYNIAIEYNGSYWHSFEYKETKLQREYHLYKTEKCEDKRIKLFHINEYDNIVIWKSMLSTAFNKNNKVGARNFSVGIVNKKEYKNFCDENHIQGYCQASIILGLYDKNNILYSLMSFSKPRFGLQHKYEYELIRFCSKRFVTVIGGFSKLIKAFIKQYKPKTILTFGNRRWTSIHNNVYKTFGFVLDNKTTPNYVYLLKGEPFSRNAFQKHKLEKKLLTFDKHKTEYENMFNAGYRRMWDSGNLKYILDLHTD